MRRPVRPFVTEYRGSTRRAAHQSHGLEVDPFKTEPGPSSAGVWPPIAPLQHEPQEDGYDAALRAADALFAGNRSASQSQSAAEGEEPKPGSGGRVLRVLDEAPPQEMLRLEEAFAPKKRGRKPGSKNKPKVTALAAEDPIAAPPAASTSATINEAPAVPAVTSLAAVHSDAAIQAARTSGVPLTTAPRGERYAWVRTRLKPGQQWKRRLPKVAW